MEFAVAPTTWPPFLSVVDAPSFPLSVPKSTILTGYFFWS